MMAPTWQGLVRVFSSSGYSHMPGVRMTLCTVTIEVCIDNLDVIPLNARTFQFSRVLASSDSRAPHFVLRPSDQRRDASAMAGEAVKRIAVGYSTR